MEYLTNYNELKVEKGKLDRELSNTKQVIEEELKSKRGNALRQIEQHIIAIAKETTTDLENKLDVQNYGLDVNSGIGDYYSRKSIDRLLFCKDGSFSIEVSNFPRLAPKTTVKIRDGKIIIPFTSHDVAEETLNLIADLIINKWQQIKQSINDTNSARFKAYKDSIDRKINALKVTEKIYDNFVV